MAGFPNPVMGNDASQDRASIDKRNHDDNAPTLSGLIAGVTSVSLDGTDVRGVLIFVVGGASVAAFSTIVTVTFAKPFEKAPVILMHPQDAAGGGGPWQPFNITNTGFQITNNTLMAASTTYHVGYHFVP